MRRNFSMRARELVAHPRARRRGAGFVCALAACASLVAVPWCPQRAVAATSPERSPPCPAQSATTDRPIVVGDLSTLSGRFHFPESAQAATAAFDAVNAQCGINGRRIAYDVVDDAGDPDKAAELARVLINQRGAVALVGGTSAVSCAVNEALFASAPIAAIPGIGTLPRCFDSPNSAPPNTGVFAITTLALKFAVRHLAPKKLCLVGNAHPNIPGNFRDPVEHFQKITGSTATIVNQELHIDDDPGAVVEQLQSAQCDVVFVGTLAKYAARLADAIARAPSMRLKLVLAPEAYTTAFASRLDPALDGRVYATTDMDFLDSTKPGMTRIRTRLQGAGIELSPFAVGGDLAAQILVDVLRSMRGTIDRETVLNALRIMPPYDTQGVTAFSYVFAWTDDRRSAPAIHVVVWRNGAWAHATEDWITLK